MTRHYKILVDYGHKKLTMKKIYIYAVDIESSKILKYYTFLIKHWFFLLCVISVIIMIKRYSKKNNQLRY